MRKLGMILGPVVAVLAIAIAALSFVVSSRRMEFRDRAAILAKGVVDTTQKLDAQTGSGTAAKVTFTPAAPGTKESGALGWPSYHADKAEYQKTIDAAVKLAGDINSQRGELALGIYEMSIALQLPESALTQDSLNTLSTYKNAIADAKSHATAVRNRNDVVIDALKAYSTEVGMRLNTARLETRTEVKVTDEDGNEIGVKLGEFDCKKPLDDLRGAIKNVNDRRKAFEATLKSTPDKIPEFAWSAQVENLSGRGFASVLAALEDDYSAINGKLVELKRTIEDLAKVKQEKQELEEAFTELKDKNATLEQDIAALKKQVRDLGGESEVGVAKVIESIQEVDPNTTGSVLVTNPQWNFVVTDMGEELVIAEVPVIISSEGKYLASGIVKKVEKKVSLVEVIRGDAASIPDNAQVFVNLTVKDESPGDDEN
ncbi:MAG: hypothetical protein GX937_05015 [Lentisphaerae bacterium]|mgnify:FL=1|nr:hypothetical protein [Lentisphaerota bacterium]